MISVAGEHGRRLLVVPRHSHDASQSPVRKARLFHSRVAARRIADERSDKESQGARLRR
jgi:hypothetical protein